MLKKFSIVYFFRNPHRDNYSIEELFNNIIQQVSKTNKSKVYRLKYKSKGIINRINGLIETYKNKGGINHITGDIHFIAISLPRNNTVLTIHDIAILKRTKGFKKAVIKYLWYTLPAKRVKYITVISEFTKRELLSEIKVNSDKVKVIPNPVSPLISFSKRKTNQLNRKFTILQIGTKWNKNLDRVVESVKNLNVKLLIIGHLNTQQLQLLDSMGIDYENYFNLSFKEIIQVYQRADLVTFVSLYEGFGMPIIEAQATGRPVITSNLSSMPEVAEKSAVLVDPYSINQIREAIIKLKADSKLYDTYVQKGLENVKRYQVEVIARKYNELYNTILNCEDGK